MEVFMTIKKKGLIVAAAVVTAALVLLAVGCSRSNAASTSSGPAIINEGWFAGRDFSKHYDIDYAGIQIDEAKDYNDGDAFVKQFREKFNVKWNITPIAWESWQERLRVWINSGDAPEMFVLDFNFAEAVGYAEQGMIKELPKDWRTKYPNLAKAQDNVPIAKLTEDAMGGTYLLFRPMFANDRPAKKLSDHVTPWVRKDWAEAVGVQLKEAMTITEIFDYARKVKAANPGRVANFYPINATSLNMSLFVMANNSYSGYYSPFYKGTDGKYHWGPGDASTLEALKIISQAYREGLIDPEFYTLTDNQDSAKFYTAGTSAMMWGGAMAVGFRDVANYFKQDLSLDFADVAYATTILGTDNHYHGYSLQNYWGTNGFSPDIPDDKFDRILQMMDYSCTEEGQLEIRLGVKGVDWDIGSDGKPFSKMSADEILWDKYAMLPIYVNMMILSDDFQFTDLNYPEWARNQSKKMYQDREKYSTDLTLAPEPDQHVALFSSRAMNQANMTYSDEYAALIVRAGDIEANWRAWVNEKMTLIQPVLNELNAGL
jgi:putative aldouronate transport system substrate-binding protein